jgi:hypothetical protein
VTVRAKWFVRLALAKFARSARQWLSNSGDVFQFDSPARQRRRHKSKTRKPFVFPGPESLILAHKIVAREK